MSRKSYACQCLFKQGRNGIKKYFGKTIFVFSSQKERNTFIEGKNSQEFFVVSQKEAYAIADLNRPGAIPCVYKHSQSDQLNVLAEIKQCYGSIYTKLTEFV